MLWPTPPALPGSTLLGKLEHSYIASLRKPFGLKGWLLQRGLSWSWSWGLWFWSALLPLGIILRLVIIKFSLYSLKSFECVFAAANCQPMTSLRLECRRGNKTDVGIMNLEPWPVKVTAKRSRHTKEQQSCRAAAEGDTNASILYYISQLNWEVWSKGRGVEVTKQKTGPKWCHLCWKPMIPNIDGIPELTAVSASPQNCLSQPGLFWSMLVRYSAG